MSAPQTDAELLKRAVVSLERKLREAGAANAALEQANQAAAREAAELPAVRGRLDEALAATQSLLEDNARLQREAAAARADAEQVQRQRDAAALELQQGAHWRGDAEALEVELTRARGRAEVLGQQVGQLEAANAEVRQDNQRHASQLKEAYQREGELLAEVAELRSKLRRAQEQAQLASCSCCSSGGGAATLRLQPPIAAGRHSGSQPASPTRQGSMEETQNQMVLAAQKLTARAEQAERRAGHLELELHGMAATADRLREQLEEQAASLAAAQDRASQEQQAAQALLDTNMRLHETVAQLMEDGAGSSSIGGWGGASADSSDAWEVAPPAASAARPAVPSWRPPRTAPSQPAPLQEACRAAPKSSGSQAAALAALSRGSKAPAAKPQAAGKARRPSGQPQTRQQPRQQQTPQEQQEQPRQPSAAEAAARQAAVTAALQMSGEHRELLQVYRAVAAEQQQVASTLATAPASQQLVLLRRHAQLQAELRDVCQRLEDKALQLAEVRRAGLL